MALPCATICLLALKIPCKITMYAIILQAGNQDAG